MICHDAIAVESATDQTNHGDARAGDRPSWQRVYATGGLAREVQSPPHIRAKVECATCHGNIGSRPSPAERRIDEGYCVNCHTARKVSIDCLTCHF